MTVDRRPFLEFQFRFAFSGVPHTTMQNLTKISPPLSPCSSITGTSITTASDFADIDFVAAKPVQNPVKSPIMQFNSADVRDSLDRKTSAFREVLNLNDERSAPISHRHTHSATSSMSENSNLDSNTESYKRGPTPPISSNHEITSTYCMAPPPYRNPPSPKTASPLLHQYNNLLIQHQKTDSQSSNTTNNSSSHNSTKFIDFGANKSASLFAKEVSPSPTTAANQYVAANRQASPNIHINALSNLQAIVNSATSDRDLMNDNQFQNAQYRELLQLIHFQREKISTQQSDISKVSIR